MAIVQKFETLEEAKIRTSFEKIKSLGQEIKTIEDNISFFREDFDKKPNWSQKKEEELNDLEDQLFEKRIDYFKNVILYSDYKIKFYQELGNQKKVSEYQDIKDQHKSFLDSLNIQTNNLNRQANKNTQPNSPRSHSFSSINSVDPTKHEDPTTNKPLKSILRTSNNAPNNGANKRVSFADNKPQTNGQNNEINDKPTNNSQKSPQEKRTQSTTNENVEFGRGFGQNPATSPQTREVNKVNKNRLERHN